MERAEELYQLISENQDVSKIADIIQSGPEVLRSKEFLADVCPLQISAYGSETYDFDYTNKVLNTLEKMKEQNLVSAPQISAVINAQFPQTGETLLTTLLKYSVKRMKPTYYNDGCPDPKDIVASTATINRLINPEGAFKANVNVPNVAGDLPLQILHQANKFSDADPNLGKSSDGYYLFMRDVHKQIEAQTKNPQEAVSKLSEDKRGYYDVFKLNFDKEKAPAPRKPKVMFNTNYGQGRL